MPVPFVDLAVQYRRLEREIKEAMDVVLTQASFVLGPDVDAFEQAFAEFVGVPHAVGVSSGLDALRLALAVLDVGPGDEVVLPANTFIATALAVSAVGARPVLVDCDRATYNIDVSRVAQAITPRTKVLLPVHLTGQAADLDPLLELAQARGLHVVEDAAQAHGTRYKQRVCGSLGTLGCFSFYPGKNLGAYGEGGLVTTSDRQLADRLRRLRNCGQRAKYEHLEKGLNARLDTLQAAILRVKLKYLPEWNQARAAHAARYALLLSGVGDLRFQTTAPFSSHIYHLLVIETGSRDALQKHLADRGIQTGIHYPVPIHLQPAYQDLGYHQGDFPVSEELATRMLSLPMYPELTQDHIGEVAGAVRAFFTRG
jgi:dTDP-4-amino-4,6-dideoxygalactose transaminase